MKRAVLAVWLAACGSSDDGPPPAPVQPPALPSDAGVTGLGSVPTTLQSDPPPVVVAPPPGKPRTPTPIDVMLRSSPTGARASVDGMQIGITPTMWAGEADGKPHEFTFYLDKHAIARYRFVPVTGGVVHARLEPLVEAVPTDAGVK